MTTNASHIDALTALDRSVDDLATSGDMDALGGLLADEFVYTHSTGKVEPKGEWIEGLARLVGQRDRVAMPVTAEVHGDLGIVLGDLDIRWKSDRADAYNRYARIYRLVDGEWRVIAQRTVPAYDRAP
jgi:ketosteroid isomerase-like protein